MKNKSCIDEILSHRIIDEIYLRKKIKKYKQFYCTRIFDIFLDTDYDTKKEYETLYKLSTLSSDKFYIQNFNKKSEIKTDIEYLNKDDLYLNNTTNMNDSINYTDNINKTDNINDSINYIDNINYTDNIYDSINYIDNINKTDNIYDSINYIDNINKTDNIYDSINNADNIYDSINYTDNINDIKDNTDNIVIIKKLQEISINNKYKKLNTFSLFYNKLDINIKTIHQIHIDIKRLSDVYKKSGTTDISYIYYNILFLISHRRFKLGYVQGMADFLVPLICEYSREDIQTSENKSYYAYLEIIRRVEFNIINLQGNLILRLREELENIDPTLYTYLHSISLDFHIFSFRWFNCLFFREFQYKEYLRIFTVILAYKDINRILLYIAVGILTVLRKEIFKLDYNGIVLMIQDLYNKEWSEGEIDEILNRANVLYKMGKI